MAIQDVQDNARYLMGFIAKEIRMSQIITSDGVAYDLNIVNSEGDPIKYSFTGNTGNPDTAWQITREDRAINSKEVDVDGWFYVGGRAAGDIEQPRVTVIMKVSTTGIKHEEQSEINLQTTLSQRKLE